MAKNYEARLKLSNFIDSRLQELEDNDGNMEMCLVIPIEKNSLDITKHNDVFCSMFVNEKTYETKDGYAYYFKQKTNSNHVAKLDSLGYKTPYLGYMTLSKYSPRFQSNIYNKKVKNIED